MPGKRGDFGVPGEGAFFWFWAVCKQYIIYIYVSYLEDHDEHADHDDHDGHDVHDEGSCDDYQATSFNVEFALVSKYCIYFVVSVLRYIS